MAHKMIPRVMQSVGKSIFVSFQLYPRLSTVFFVVFLCYYHQTTFSVFPLFRLFLLSVFKKYFLQIFSTIGHSVLNWSVVAAAAVEVDVLCLSFRRELSKSPLQTALDFSWSWKTISIHHHTKGSFLQLVLSCFLPPPTNITSTR